MPMFFRAHFYPLFAVVLFFSSLLLFLVQPLLSKHMLPWFGGSAAVWVTAVTFFITTLFLGYLYALWLSRMRPVVQAAVHGALVLSAVGLIVLHGLSWPSPITADVSTFPLGTWVPSLEVLWVLTVSVGLPFFVLSSTSSLLQQWYHRLSEKEPYSLYAISNLGSLLGLLGYVFLLEPSTSTVMQGFYWGFGFGLVAFGLLCVAAVFGYAARIENSNETRASTHTIRTGVRTYAIWVGLSALPVLVLLTGTDYMTSLIAPIPLLWVLPLVLYLLSFVYAFRTQSSSVGSFHYLLGGFLVSIVTMCVMSSFFGAPILILLLLVAMGVVFVLCHVALYARRPHGYHSSEFYVATSLGGVVASVFAILIELYVLPIEVELFAFLFTFGAGAVYYSSRMPDSVYAIHSEIVRRSLLQFICVLPLVVVALHIYAHTGDVLALSRNFFGAKVVTQEETDEYVARHLLHGATRHGTQYLTGEFANRPAAYYTPTSGVGRSFEVLQQRRTEAVDKSLDVGIVGLGAGALSAYCRPGDRFVYWEIDPEVVELARKYFTFLSMCDDTDVRIEDGRLGLERELGVQGADAEGIYDLIVIDAYADDVVPVHLLTKEAFASYLALLREEGLLAVHISSRYLDLVPVLRAMARVYGLHSYYVWDVGSLEYAVSSQWVIFAETRLLPEEESFLSEESIGEGEEVLWTDTYSSMVSIVRWRF